MIFDTDVIEKEKKYKIIGLFDNKFSQKDKVLNYPILDQKKYQIKIIKIKDMD